MDSELLQGFRLGDLLIEPLQGRVSGHGRSAHLPPKAVEVLLCLAQSPGEMITRKTLLKRAWGDGHGSTEALSHAIGEIRHALGLSDGQNTADIGLFENLSRRGVLETGIA